MDWKSQTITEISLAEKASFEGKKGKARVSARRAARFVIQEYFLHRGIIASSINTMSCLNQLQSLPNVSPMVQDIAQRLQVHLNPDFTHPHGSDLITEVRKLARELLGEEL